MTTPSDGTPDRHNAVLREYVTQRADLLGAIRLPNDAFKRGANTEVTADMVILRERLPPRHPGAPPSCAQGACRRRKNSL